MFTVTLISDSGKVTPELSQALALAWGGGGLRSLGDAAAFDVPARPDNFDRVWQDMQDLKVDIVILPAQNLRKKVLLADMDSTMIRQECIDELADHVGVGARVAEITAKAMNEELDFEAALDERVALLAGHDASIIDEVLNTRITLMPGGKTLVATMKAHKAYTALVSGGFTAFTGHIAETLGFDEHRANTLLTQDGRLTGQAARPILGREAKVQALHDITGKLGLSALDVMAVGDGANDLGMLTLAGCGVALHAKPAVQAQCDVRINHSDLTALLYIQGYSKDEFVS